MQEIITLDNRINHYKAMVQMIPMPKTVSLPADFAEKNIRLTRDVSPITGKYSYDHTPWWREVANRFHPKDPAKVIVVVKDGQSGATQGVVVPVTAWTISEDPCNIMVTSGNEQLSKEFVSTRLDPALKSAGIMHLIKPNVIRARNAKSGNTDAHKQFAGGNAFFVSIGSIDTVGKQKSLTKGIFDDYSASAISDDKQGSLFNILQQRFNTSAMTMKQSYISTMENSPDPTYILFLMGDQRKWHVPCPCCTEFIELKFSIESDGKNCGIVYEKGDDGLLVKGSVMYRCQNCFGEWPESEKYKIQPLGKWIPTTKPKRPGWYSYQKSGVYNPAQFAGWDTIVTEWLDVFVDGSTDTSKLKALKTLRLGEPYEDKRENVSTNELLMNAGGYENGTIPDIRSANVGAGRIVLITAGVDCGGTINDARLDFEIVAWSEFGQSFSIETGEIGTYQAKSKNKERIKWTYNLGQKYCVWDKLTEIMNYQFPCESKSGFGEVSVTAIDSGYLEDEVTAYIALGHIPAFSVKGDGKKLFVEGADVPIYKKSSKVQGLIISNTNHVKESVSKQMAKKWEEDSGNQPPSYMNFPEIGGNYQLKSYFDQMTGEERIPETGSSGIIKGYKYVPKKGVQNHKFDCRCNASIGKQVFIDEFLDKIKSRWADYVKLVTK